MACAVAEPVGYPFRRHDSSVSPCDRPRGRGGDAAHGVCRLGVYVHTHSHAGGRAGLPAGQRVQEVRGCGQEIRVLPLPQERGGGSLCEVVEDGARRSAEDQRGRVFGGGSPRVPPPVVGLHRRRCEDARHSGHEVYLLPALVHRRDVHGPPPRRRQRDSCDARLPEARRHRRQGVRAPRDGPRLSHRERHRRGVHQRHARGLLREARDSHSADPRRRHDVGARLDSRHGEAGRPPRLQPRRACAVAHADHRGHERPRGERGRTRAREAPSAAHLRECGRHPPGARAGAALASCCRRRARRLHYGLLFAAGLRSLPPRHVGAGRADVACDHGRRVLCAKSGGPQPLPHELGVRRRRGGEGGGHRDGALQGHRDHDQRQAGLGQRPRGREPDLGGAPGGAEAGTAEARPEAAGRPSRGARGPPLPRHRGS
mmetsp:Transcript_15708/g.45075  ORF Transcript_15708/g.45075 Transcript_15708/m.45075 type:complete len:429 (+) Transcript_15708:1119-2405(+)